MRNPIVEVLQIISFILSVVSTVNYIKTEIEVFAFISMLLLATILVLYKFKNKLFVKITDVTLKKSDDQN